MNACSRLLSSVSYYIPHMCLYTHSRAVFSSHINQLLYPVHFANSLLACDWKPMIADKACSTPDIIQVVGCGAPMQQGCDHWHNPKSHNVRHLCFSYVLQGGSDDMTIASYIQCLSVLVYMACACAVWARNCLFPELVNLAESLVK